MIVAIDGPAGSGKSSTARLLARRLKLTYLDTGAMYRAVALLFLKEGIEPEAVGISSLLHDHTLDISYRSDDFVGTSSRPWGFNAVNESRGQLNASVNYYINDHFTVGVDAINITQSDRNQYCVNEGALLCYQGLTDRRILLGASYRF